MAQTVICLQCGRPRFKPWVKEDPLEKELATHSSILAWRIPWTEESGRLQFIGHKESDTTEQLTHTHTHTHNCNPNKAKMAFGDAIFWLTV